MKRSTPFTCLLFCMAMSLLLASCGGGDKKTTETPSGDTNTTPDAKVNTIVTTPELLVMIKHKVKDFASWKMAYDGHDSARLANGLHNYVIGRGTDDSMMVMVALKADNLDKAKAFSKDPGLKDVMQKAGVMGAPEINFVNVLWQDTVDVGSIPRVASSFTVKDWDAWKKAFEEGNQERMDNGIVVRNYGHDADDNHNVRIVTALKDVEKAKAYWASDAMKKRIEAGGLTIQPNRFIFNIVARYRK